jgi:hypothetical protein
MRQMYVYEGDEKMNWEECNFLRVFKHKKFRTNEEVIDSCSCRLVNIGENEYGNCGKEKCIFIKIMNK